MKRLFIKKIKDFNAYKQYRRNFSLDRDSLAIYQGEIMPRYECLQTILNENYSRNEMLTLLIDYSFDWSVTDEGSDFWYNIHINLQYEK